VLLHLEVAGGRSNEFQIAVQTSVDCHDCFVHRHFRDGRGAQATEAGGTQLTPAEIKAKADSSGGGGNSNNNNNGKSNAQVITECAAEHGGADSDYCKAIQNSIAASTGVTPTDKCSAAQDRYTTMQSNATSAQQIISLH